MHTRRNGCCRSDPELSLTEPDGDPVERQLWLDNLCVARIPRDQYFVDQEPQESGVRFGLLRHTLDSTPAELQPAPGVAAMVPPLVTALVDVVSVEYLPTVESEQYHCGQSTRPW